LITDDYPSDLFGDYQRQNKKTVLQALKVLQETTSFQIKEKNIKKGLLNVVKNTGLQGRWQQLGVTPKIICDTAHNEHGLKIVINQLKKEKFAQLHIVLGMVNDKNLNDILPIFPKNAKYYFCKPIGSRGLETLVLQKKASEFGLKGKIYNSVSEAYNEARQKATSEDFIYVGGSTFVVAEIL
jgi:dihydrofolate synthase/folylpolyglutamate synthase